MNKNQQKTLDKLLPGRLETTYERLTFCCGVSEVGDFVFYSDSDSYSFNPVGAFDHSEAEVPNIGTGLFVSTFIDSIDCEAAYRYLCATHQLLSQTKPYLNSTGTDVFLCVFLHKDAEK